ncbi:DUF2975 domain-containing protein [Cellulomonas triticagri]|uniref:DUF2975 domain-containing protein n=1 Tax=Cellulomonas triticagri TaxID=2483352 RepID=A0A3M2JM25_9CELL|nr:DUF2975 domain-containing protein [Cellulomonas triticagri]RMI13326.1 DUF2975 domain-containing protein [Cellulomonas triticagri]
MTRWAVLALRALIAVLLAGLLLVQVVIVPLLMADLDGSPEAAHLRWPLGVVAVLGLATVEVALVCVWRLLALVRRGTVFSPAAFRWVDVIAGSAVGAWLLTIVLAFVLAPGEAVAPGVVLLVVLGGVAAAGVALLVLVLRALLVQATALRAELAEVV